MRLEGFEPPVSSFGGKHVIQLRYRREEVVTARIALGSVVPSYLGSSGIGAGDAVGRCLKRSSL